MRNVFGLIGVLLVCGFMFLGCQEHFVSSVVNHSSHTVSYNFSNWKTDEKNLAVGESAFYDDVYLSFSYIKVDGTTQDQKQPAVKLILKDLTEGEFVDFAPIPVKIENKLPIAVVLSADGYMKDEPKNIAANVNNDTSAIYTEKPNLSVFTTGSPARVVWEYKADSTDGNKPTIFVIIY